MKRYGMVIRVRPEKLEEYKRLHAKVWPAVLRTISECNICNYSIYHKDGYLFSYFEYHGGDFGADMAKMVVDPVIPTHPRVGTKCVPSRINTDESERPKVRRKALISGIWV